MKIFKWHIISETDLAYNQSDNYRAGHITGYDLAKTEMETEIEKWGKERFRDGRDFEFQTINDHIQGMFNARMNENVEWVVQRFRELQKET